MVATWFIELKSWGQCEICCFWIEKKWYICTCPPGKEEKIKTILRTHHQVSYYHDQQEDEKAQRLPSYFHTVPHGLDPLSAQNPEDDEEGVEEVIHVPPWKVASRAYLLHIVQVALPKELHPHHSKNKDDDGQHESEVTQGAHGVANDFNECV